MSRAIVINVYNGQPASPVAPQNLLSVVQGWMRAMGNGDFGAMAPSQVADVFGQLGRDCNQLKAFLESLASKEVKTGMNAALLREAADFDRNLAPAAGAATSPHRLGNDSPLAGWTVFEAFKQKLRSMMYEPYLIWEDTDISLGWRAAKDGVPTVHLTRDQYVIVKALDRPGPVDTKELHRILEESRRESRGFKPTLDMHFDELRVPFAAMGVRLHRLRGGDAYQLVKVSPPLREATDFDNAAQALAAPADEDAPVPADSAAAVSRVGADRRWTTGRSGRFTTCRTMSPQAAAPSTSGRAVC